ncbi:hypothetical protein GYMLUDRAFT_37110 [Collybiopsis luxurians FD-317 M1]|nr:hypothetical protein GYMLUDRAFT_37110 [Collybiopsis luxurians FD-317 M1]
MPLPSATYTLQGQAKPADQPYTKPKHGMLLRLSTEAANALQTDSNAMPNVQFVVADDGSSRIVIGDSSFPLQTQTEEIPHDLYLRSTTAAKPFAPLKFHANIIGKLTISERELDDELASRIHQKTAAAAEQRSMSKTKFIDTNQLPQSNAKSTKKNLFMKPLRPSDQPKPSLLNSSTSSTVLPPRPSNPSKNSQGGITSMHKRLIHFLATSERTTEEAVKAVGGPNCDANARQEISDALEMVAEQGPATKSSQQIWRLKNESWLDVRPYEWPRLSETDRTSLARGARMALKALGIPESDPRWEHAKFRLPPNPPSTARTNSPIPSNSSATPSTSNTPATAPPKRPITSTGVRKGKTRKPDPKAEVMIKDETKPRPPSTSLPSTSANSNLKNSKSSGASTSSNSSTSTRLSSQALHRTPGSGFKLPQKPVGEASRPIPLPPLASSSSPTLNDIEMKDGTRRPVKAEQRVSTSRIDTSPSKKEEGELSASSNGPGGIGARDTEKPAPVKRVKNLRDQAIDSDRESDKGRDRPREKARERADNRLKDWERDRNRAPDRDRSLERRDRESARRQSDTAPLKRKKVKEEEDDYEESSSRAGSKRRRTEDPEELLSAPGVPPRDRERERERERDSKQVRDRSRDQYDRTSRDPRPGKSINERPMDKKAASNSLSLKGKVAVKEPSPLSLAPRNVKKDSSVVPPPPRLAASSSASSSTKSSSIKSTKSRRKSPIYTSSEDEGNSRQPSLASPTPPTASSSSSSSHHSHTSANGVSTHTHDGDRRVLRTKYTASYVEYLGTLHTLLAQKSEIERLLASESRPGSRSGSDGEVELLDYEGLSKILTENKQQWDVLQSIQQAWGE